MPASPPKGRSPARLLNPGLRSVWRKLSQTAASRKVTPASQARKLKALKFNESEIAAISSFCPSAALQQVQDRSSERAFFEGVRREGELLARMNVHPDRVVLALSELSESLLSALEAHEVPIKEGRVVLDQLQYLTLLKINESYRHVRERETRALHALHLSGLECSSPESLWKTFANIAAESAQAVEAHVFLLNGENLAHCAGTRPLPAKGEVTLAARVRKKLEQSCVVAPSKASDEPLKLVTTEGAQGWWSLPLSCNGEFRGVLQLGFSATKPILPRDRELLLTAGERSLIAADRLRFLSEMGRREENMRQLARRMLQVEEIERRRISRELHDDPAQSLATIRLHMELIEYSLPEGTEEVRERLADVRKITEKTITTVRRLISDLSPAVLEQLGLAAGLRQLISRFRRAYPCTLHLQISKLPKMERDFEMVVYRLVQECLANISRHSAAGDVNISISSADGVLRLQIEDNGLGFDVDEGMSRRQCFGLIGMRERIAILGGTMEIESRRQGSQAASTSKKAGTEIRIYLPIPSISSRFNGTVVVR